MGFKTELNSSLSLRYFGQSSDISFPNTAPKSTLNAHEPDCDYPVHSEEDYNWKPVPTVENSADQSESPVVKEFYRTELGKMMQGNCLNYMSSSVPDASVDLIMTSPPFALNRKKAYGNVAEADYCAWFKPFALEMHRILKDSGSLVLDIGGVWDKGQPTRSLYHFKLLIMLVEECGYYLAQEHYWHNPSKLPSPIEWVNKKRVRVKDSVNTVWWLSKSPHPKADNRRVLQAYSASMKKQWKTGGAAGLRPSGHEMTDKFTDVGGSIPANLIVAPNSASSGQYFNYCKEAGLTPHPARFPEKLPEYFIKFLTTPGDLVLDPFAGSCTTGAVAEKLGRRWVCCDASEDYLRGAVGRFVS